MNKFFPEKIKTPGQNKSLVDKQIKNLFNKEHLFYKKYKIEISVENWERFCAVKRRLKKVVDKKNQLHFQTLIAAESKSNKKSFFETFNLQTGKESGSKPNLTVEQCQEFNQFFTSVAEKMNKKCKGNWNPDKIQQVRCSMYLPNVTNNEVEKIVMSLITKYTSDCFEISVFVIQSLIFGILDALTFFINKALKAQTFPECLKRAVFVPILSLEMFLKLIITDPFRYYLPYRKSLKRLST